MRASARQPAALSSPTVPLLLFSLTTMCSLLAACSADREPPLMKAPQVTVAVPTRPAAAPTAPPPSAAEPANSAKAESAEAPGSVIYFDSDAYAVKEEYRPLLQAYARKLLADPSLHLRIDAHTDDRGPEDYNLELARMRAQSVMKQLVKLGVPASQMQVVGHGKDKPAGHGRQALAESRRVELSYR